jgi:hypothetical protein
MAATGGAGITAAIRAGIAVGEISAIVALAVTAAIETIFSEFHESSKEK